MNDQAQDHGFSPEFAARVAAMILTFQRNAAARAAARASQPDDPPTVEEVLDRAAAQGIPVAVDDLPVMVHVEHPPERPCRPCDDDDHERCLRPLRDQSNLRGCCCDDLDGWWVP